MSKSFFNISTYSEGKKLTEEKLDNILKNRGITKANGLAFFLVGDAETGYKRHYKRSVEELGFSPSQTVFVERNKKTYTSLRKYKLQHGYENHVVRGDIIKIIEQFAQKSHKIIYIEADGVDTYGKLDFKLYELCKKHKIPYVSINGSLRRQSKEFTLEAAKLSIRRTIDKRNPRQGLRYDAKRIIPIIARNKLLKSCEFNFEPYRGRSNMYISTIINKKWAK